MLNKELKKLVVEHSDWFNIREARLIDDVIMMLDYIRFSNESNEILDHILTWHNFDKLPEAPASWKYVDVVPLRIYYIIKEAVLYKNNAARWLCDKIKINGKYIVIEDSHDAQGTNK